MSSFEQPFRGILFRMRSFDSLTEREILALAIGLEEEDERVYADYAHELKQDFPSTAAIFDGMREEESTHRRRLIDLFREKFGDHIPLVRRQDVRGFVSRKAVWLTRPLRLQAVREQVSAAGTWIEELGQLPFDANIIRNLRRLTHARIRHIQPSSNV